MHTVCRRVSAEFLEFSASQGNDLRKPMSQYGFAGLKPGVEWLVCAARWEEAFEAGQTATVVLESTHVSSLEYFELDDLQGQGITA